MVSLSRRGTIDGRETETTTEEEIDDALGRLGIETVTQDGEIQT